ncbi:hypothetical protein ACNSOS_00850 [Aliarcobacter vitoriensis]|uniref:hypothetical protein n=1 Tax=Aliarcobacter vitoriensis TaxID=2011099 RepID=UPI003AABA49A
MQTIKLNVSDKIYSQVMFFLKNLKSDEIEIVEEKNLQKGVNDDIKTLNTLFEKSNNKITLTKDLSINTNEQIDDIS